MFGIWLKEFVILDRRIGFSVENCVYSRLETSVDLDLGRKMRKMRFAYLTLGGDSFERRIVGGPWVCGNGGRGGIYGVASYYA